jgi:hypothetical protein
LFGSRGLSVPDLWRGLAYALLHLKLARVFGAVVKSLFGNRGLMASAPVLPLRGVIFG